MAIISPGEKPDPMSMLEPLEASFNDEAIRIENDAAAFIREFGLGATVVNLAFSEIRNMGPVADLNLGLLESAFSFELGNIQRALESISDGIIIDQETVENLISEKRFQELFVDNPRKRLQAHRTMHRAGKSLKLTGYDDSGDRTVPIFEWTTTPPETLKEIGLDIDTIEEIIEKSSPSGPSKRNYYTSFENSVAINLGGRFSILLGKIASVRPPKVRDTQIKTRVENPAFLFSSKSVLAKRMAKFNILETSQFNINDVRFREEFRKAYDAFMENISALRSDPNQFVANLMADLIWIPKGAEMSDQWIDLRLALFRSEVIKHVDTPVKTHVNPASNLSQVQEISDSAKTEGSIEVIEVDNSLEQFEIPDIPVRLPWDKKRKIKGLKVFSKGENTIYVADGMSAQLAKISATARKNCGTTSSGQTRYDDDVFKLIERLLEGTGFHMDPQTKPFLKNRAQQDPKYEGLNIRTNQGSSADSHRTFLTTVEASLLLSNGQMKRHNIDPDATILVVLAEGTKQTQLEIAQKLTTATRSELKTLGLGPT